MFTAVSTMLEMDQRNQDIETPSKVIKSKTPFQGAELSTVAELPKTPTKAAALSKTPLIPAIATTEAT